MTVYAVEGRTVFGICGIHSCCGGEIGVGIVKPAPAVKHRAVEKIPFSVSPVNRNPVKQGLGIVQTAGHNEISYVGKIGLFAVSAVSAPAAAPAAVGEGAKVEAPMPGTILEVKVAVGDTVKAGQPVVVLEAMKMEIPVVAPEDGQVLSINAAEGDSIETGDTVACLKPQSAGE